MIAELKKESSDTATDLFAGLSFPTVPTTAIILPKFSTESTRNNDETSFELTTMKSSSQAAVEENEKETETTSLLSPTNSEVSERTAVDSKKKAGSLSTLYATEVIEYSTTSTYPELPSLGLASPTRNGSSTMQRDDDISQSNEYSSLLSNSSSTTATTQAAAPTVQVHQQQQQLHSNQQVYVASPPAEESTLLIDLIRENTRLTDELANLRGILSLQQEGRTSTTSAVTTNQAQRAPATATRPNTAAATNTQQSPSTGVRVNDTTMPPRQGVKYVCCGGCRQWLMAPKDSVYVACASCQAINNCNLTPNRVAAAQRSAEQATETRALQNPPPPRSSLPWFLDCFGGSSSS